ncbi:MAG: glycerate kinase [Candidatus Hydrogenedentes bacterium]|nr:glycerate kinase [Candidatus Hydrogenedentota bacterium]
MRIVIAPDSFKECASAVEVANAIAEGVRRVYADAELVLVPMADGGEGTVDALVAATGGVTVETEVTGPLCQPVSATYGILGDGGTAVIEMSAASGVQLVPPEQRDPRLTTTRGTGELMRLALESGARRILVGVGGSATNDGGVGMAQALGFSFKDLDGEELPPGGAALARLARIDSSRKHPAMERCKILVACDVDNPLCGPHGASVMYGPQKGATPEVALELDNALHHFALIVERDLGVSVLNLPGGGAAGGLAGGLVAFAGARLRNGTELVAEASLLEERMRGANLVFTGEGQLDRLTLHGKTPMGVAQIAKSLGLPVIAITGSLGEGYRDVYAKGIDAVFAICSGPMSQAEAIARVGPLIMDTVEAVMRTWRCGRKRG